MLFEELGFRYFGPIDGHDIDALLETFTAVRDMNTPRLVHVITQKGQGFGGEHGEKWHALPPGRDPPRQALSVSAGNPHAVYGKGLAELGAERKDVAVITAAMPVARERQPLPRPIPIASSTWASRRAMASRLPPACHAWRAAVVTIYSTFLQRGYDNIIHDAALQKLPVIFAMDRAGLVGEDGETHMGLDIAYAVGAQHDRDRAAQRHQMLGLLRAGVEHTEGPFCLRYPRDASPDVPAEMSSIAAVPYGTWDVPRRGRDVAILAVGTMVEPALQAAETLAAEGLDVTVVNCRYLKPYDAVTLNAILSEHGQILTVEEGTVVNGFGAYMSAIIHRLAPQVRTAVHGVPDQIVYAAPRKKQLAALGLDAAGIAERVRALRESGHESEALAD